MSTIAISTYSFGPDAKAGEGLEFALRYGFQGLELGSYTLWPQVIHEADRRHIRMVGAAHGMDLSIHFIHRGVAPASHDPQRRARHLKELEDTLVLAQDIGARVVVVHPGPIDCSGVEPTRAPDSVKGEAVDNLHQFLETAAQKAEAVGVVICVENLHHAPGQVIQSYQALLELIEAVSSPAVQITLDTGHADLSDGIGSALETFSPFLRHIQSHDSDGKRDHLEMGAGNLDFTQWLDEFRAYPHTFVLETRNDADPEGSVLRSRDQLKALLGDAAR